MYLLLSVKHIYLGICKPTTPPKTGPEWQPILICTSFPVLGSFTMPIPSIISKARSQIIAAWLVLLTGTPDTIKYVSPEIKSKMEYFSG